MTIRADDMAHTTEQVALVGITVEVVSVCVLFERDVVGFKTA